MLAPELEKYLATIVERSGYRGRKKTELEQELRSHIETLAHEAALDGLNSQEALAKVKDCFGDERFIGQELFECSKQERRQRFLLKIIIASVLISIVQFLLLYFYKSKNETLDEILQIVLFPFFLAIVGIIMTIVSPYFYLMTATALFPHFFITRIVQPRLSPQIPATRLSALIICPAIIVTWLTLASSFKSGQTIALPGQAYGQGGFPFTAFYYSYATPAFGDWVLMTLWHCLNFLIFIAFFTLIFSLLPKKVRDYLGASPKICAALIIIATLISLNSFVYLAFKFD